MVIRIFSDSTGFSKKSKAPIFVASTAFDIVPCPESIITGKDGFFSRILFRTVIPSISGMTRSRTTRSTSFSSIVETASLPSVVVRV